MKNKFSKIGLIALTGAFSVGTVFAGSYSVGARSSSMGGAGTSSSDYLEAVFYNPALIAKYDGTDDVGILIPNVGLQIQNPYDLVTKIDDFSDLYDQVGKSTDPNDYNQLISSLKNLQGNSASFQAGFAGAIAIPNRHLSVSLFSNNYIDGTVLTDISSDDLDSSNYSSSSYELNSKGAFFGVSVSEYGIGLAKSYERVNGTLYLGITPKIQNVDTYNYVVNVNDFESDDYDADQYTINESSFNADIGAIYAFDNGFSVGLSGKNLIGNNYNMVTSQGVAGKYSINPVLIASASFSHRFFTVALDLELNETERFESFKGLHDTLFSDKDNSQMTSIGLEFNAWNWAQIRLGYKEDQSGNMESQYTAGLGFSPFNVLHLDVTANYADKNTFGVAAQTSLTF